MRRRPSPQPATHCSHWSIEGEVGNHSCGRWFHRCDATSHGALRSASAVRIIRKENGGKHTALNAGIAATRAEIVGCLDADSFVEPSALREIVACFDNPRVAAATAAMSVHKPKNILQHMQNAEYTFGITLRHAFASVNGLYVTPGPFSFYRRSIVEKLGGFRYGHQTEDMEMALRIQHAGYKIENAPRARVYTKAPDTILELIRQRTRWTSGFLRNILNEYRHLIFSRRHSALGCWRSRPHCSRSGAVFCSSVPCSFCSQKISLPRSRFAPAFRSRMRFCRTARLIGFISRRICFCSLVLPHWSLRSP